MCGIAGIFRVHEPGGAPPASDAIPDAWLDLVDAAVAHRGPDGRGRFRDRVVRSDGCTVDVALVHRRLSVIDPASGAQPLVTGEGGDLRATVFNGCIYNHRELRRELERGGRVFTTHHSDTEVIPHAHAVWGKRAPARLDGMFAYAVWSRADATLVTARDFAGEKPLYEAEVRDGRGGSVYVFASTAGAIVKWLQRFGGEAGGGRCTARGLAQWLRFGGSLTALMEGVGECGVREVGAIGGAASGASRCVVTRRSEKYAELPVRRAEGGGAPVKTVDAMIARAVRSRMEADVPLGCFLSGGVDSSLVAWHAACAMREAGNGTLRTFTVKMPDARYDESAFAERAARVIGSEHSTLACDAKPGEQLPMLIAQLGLPFADSSLLPTYWVSAAAREHVKVALTGDGGDEVFMGYERHAVARMLAEHHGVLRHLPDFARGHPKSALSKLGRLGIAARGGYDELLAIFPRPMLADLAPGLAETIRGEAVDFPIDVPRRDFETYLPADLLRKVDTGAMSVALETRAPFLAREVVDFGLGMPLEVLGRGGRKGLLRDVARLHLPASIVDRSKMGFAIPIGEWLRSDFGGMRSLLIDAVTSADAFPPTLLGTEIRREYVGRLVESHMDGTREHGQRLYLLLVLAIWCRWVRH